MISAVEILELAPKHLIGKPLAMSFVENKTAELWQSFMPRRHEIENRVSTDCVSLQKYPGGHPPVQNPSQTFTKWALVEVDKNTPPPSGMEKYYLPGGLYGKFHYQGPASGFPQVMQTIFAEWLPQSTYVLDDREHFEILPEGYNPMSETAEETIWIPLISL